MIGTDAVVVWRLHLAVGNTAPLSAVLNKDEIAQSQRLRLENKRKAFTATRGFLRKVLSTMTNVPAQELEFALGSHGKPSLVDVQNPQNIRFNVSHSGNYALVALALDAEVGIDIEQMRTGRDIEGLAETVFSAVELEQFYRLSSAKQFSAFHIAWTKKEALVKALGRGLSMPLKNFAVSLDHLTPGAPGALLWYAPECAMLADYRFHAIPIEDTSYRAALVTTQRHRLVQIYDWP